MGDWASTYAIPSVKMGSRRRPIDARVGALASRLNAAESPDRAVAARATSLGLSLLRNRGLAAKDILLDLAGGCFRQLGHNNRDQRTEDRGQGRGDRGQRTEE
jgi:hypothetical protein